MKMTQESMMSLIARSPWYLDNYFLILIPGSIEVTSLASDFEWFEGWIQVWGLDDSSYVTEKVAHNLLGRPDISAVQIKDVNKDGEKYFHIKMKISSLNSIKKYFYLQFPYKDRNSGYYLIWKTVIPMF